MNKFIDKVTRLSVLKLCLIAFALGGLSVLGLAPFYVWPVAVISFSFFLILLWQDKNEKYLFRLGWSFGFGYFLFGLYWISLALHVDWGQWWWLTPFAMIGLPMVLAIYYGLAALCIRLTPTSLTSKALLSVVAFSITEYMRGHLFTGFPWNLPAYIWVDSMIAQNLSWLGAYGLTYAFFALCAAFAYAVIRENKKAFLLPLVIVIILSGFGFLRLNTAQTVQTITDTTIMIVQPNIAQIEKWDRGKMFAHLEKTIALSMHDNAESPEFTADIILWPETGIMYPTPALQDLAPYLSPLIAENQTLLTGINAIEQHQDNNEAKFYNSLIALNNNIEITHQYNKFHLVPFGEYIPFRNILALSPVAGSVAMMGDFNRGPGPQTIKLDQGLKISPLICYEIIFPNNVTDKNDRPDLLINVTNDGWYLKSTGPYQHLSMTRARAIETGIPVARAANTGVSALVDPYGVLLLSLPLQSDGHILASIPQSLKATVYNRFGNIIFGLLVLLSGGLILLLRAYEK